MSFFCKRHKNPDNFRTGFIKRLLNSFGYYSQEQLFLHGHCEFQRGFRHGQAHETTMADADTVLNLLKAFTSTDKGRILH